MSTITVAAAQFFSGADVPANLELCRSYIRQAAEASARLVVLPENANRVRDFADREECWEYSEDLDGDFSRGLAAAAAECGVYVAAGIDLRGATRPDVYISSVLYGPDGRIVGVYRKHVLWDYEYTLFVPGDEPLQVFDTEIGRLGLQLCADGIVPEVPRGLALLGAQVLINSLNSRGPDELRVHVPLRAMENRVWHVSANTVGGPADAFPWMGGSQIVGPDGARVATGPEDAPALVVGEIDPAQADDKHAAFGADAFGWRRPDLYGLLTTPHDDLPVRSMYGPAPGEMPHSPVRVAALQVSWFHNTVWTITRAASQIEYAGRQGVDIGVLPALFCLTRGQAAADPKAAAQVCSTALDAVAKAAAAASMFVAVHLVEEDSGRYYSTAFLLDRSGKIVHRYRKTHLNDRERTWATAGDRIDVAHTAIGTLGFLLGDEVWVPEHARVLTLLGAEIFVHAADWDSAEAAELAATERVEENRVHMVSATRLDSPCRIGSQIVRADLFDPGQPIALMRYPTGHWSRPGFEEQLRVDLDRREAHSKMMGHWLDPVATRAPQIYDPFIRAAAPAS